MMLVEITDLCGTTHDARGSSYGSAAKIWDILELGRLDEQRYFETITGHEWNPALRALGAPEELLPKIYDLFNPTQLLFEPVELIPGARKILMRQNMQVLTGAPREVCRLRYARDGLGHLMERTHRSVQHKGETLIRLVNGNRGIFLGDTLGGALCERAASMSSWAPWFTHMDSTISACARQRRAIPHASSLKISKMPYNFSTVCSHFQVINRHAYK